MENFDIVAWVVGTGVTVATVILSVVWFLVGQLNKYVDDRMTTAQTEADKRVELIKSIADEAKREANKVREEMYQEFVRQSHYDNTSSAIFKKIQNVDDKVVHMAKDLNQLIGKMEKRYVAAES